MSKTTSTDGSAPATKADIAALHALLSSKFEEYDAQFARIAERFDTVDAQFEVIINWIDSIQADVADKWAEYRNARAAQLRDEIAIRQVHRRLERVEKHLGLVG